VPICIPTSTNANLTGLTSWATGFGTTSFRGVTSSSLLQVSMPILSDAACKSKYRNVITASEICAGLTGLLFLKSKFLFFYKLRYFFSI
jgi:hypothetical protein